MQPQIVDKIKAMVRSSALLDAAERTEWLQLVDLMNDKQLLELQRILQAAEDRQKAIDIRPTTVQPAAAKPTPSAQAMHLSHILNLPKDVRGMQGKPAGAAPARPTETASAAQPQRPPIAADKPGKSLSLKDFLNEKELPPGHPENELEIPAHFDGQNSSGTVKPGPAAMPVKPTLPSSVTRQPGMSLSDKPAPAKTEQTGKLAVAPLIPAPPTPKQPVTKPEVADHPMVIKSVEEINALKSPAAKAASQEQAAVRPGIKDTKIYLDAKLSAPKPVHVDLAADVGLPADQSAAARAAQAAATGNQLKTLDDIQKLTPPVWRAYPPGEFLDRIKGLVIRYGYHDVIFNFERSPLHQSYIDTGLKILHGRVSFEALGEEVPGAQYLSRQEFEKLVDVLRQIQAA